MNKFGKIYLLSILIGTTFIALLYFNWETKTKEWVGIEVSKWLDHKFKDPMYNGLIVSYTIHGKHANELNVVASDVIAEYGIYQKEKIFRDDLWLDFCEKRNIRLHYHTKKEELSPTDCIVNISTKKGNLLIDGDLIVDVDGTRYHRFDGKLYTSVDLIRAQREKIEKEKRDLLFGNYGSCFGLRKGAYLSCVKANERERKEILKKRFGIILE